ncbi:MAG: Smr/MutS family protein [Clostridia bacterium]|nr:Smr/MutS family protein [Clostridia bacterium]
MDLRDQERLELNKILALVSEFAVLEGGRRIIETCLPSADLSEVSCRLAATEECDKLLYKYGVSKVEYFTDLTEVVDRAAKGAALSCGELLECVALLRSARIACDGIDRISDESFEIMRKRTAKLYFDRSLEDEVCTKIISKDAVSDYASDRLYTIRSRIKSLNEKIRTKLSEYLTKDKQFLQDGIVTIRNDRYVIPVKAEYKNQVCGFVHDRSQTGATFFIEPEYVLELNNELISLTIDEREEVEAILKSLSVRIGSVSEQLKLNMEILAQIDADFARAEYCYKLHCTKPQVNGKGYINIIKGRHPLIDATNIVPVSIELGSDYDFLVLSGANTGGKTVTLKMCGLFCLMSACGLFIPAAVGSSVSVFENVFCDIGDSQSIEESLSTFSSHVINIINICNKANANSLVLIDELGGGTNPDEGQAIAKAVVKHLLSKGCKGIVTTHFTPLKEFAYSFNRIENASMEFDANTLKPLYSIKIGLAGASNALAISRRLGMSESILNDAVGFLSEGAKSFENVLHRAEESRLEAEERLSAAIALEREWNLKLAELKIQSEALEKEKEKISRSARVESRRIIAERTERAEEILNEIEKIFKADNVSESDLIKARTLKNRLEDISYDEENSSTNVTGLVQATKDNLKAGHRVFINLMQCYGQVINYSQKKGEAEISCGGMTLRCKVSDLLIDGNAETNNKNLNAKDKVKIIKNFSSNTQPVLEINVLGLTVEEALYEVDNFIDRAVTDNLEEIKVIHGVGTGKLKNAISRHLARHKNVESYRLGRYGEGETGVTIIKLK